MQFIREIEKNIDVGSVNFDESAGVYSTDISIRIDDSNGNFLGVMKVVLNIEEIINSIDEIKANVEEHTAEFKLMAIKVITLTNIKTNM